MGGILGVKSADLPGLGLPRASWTSIRSSRASTRAAVSLPAGLPAWTPCSGGTIPLSGSGCPPGRGRPRVHRERRRPGPGLRPGRAVRWPAPRPAVDLSPGGPGGDPAGMRLGVRSESRVRVSDSWTIVQLLQALDPVAALEVHVAVDDLIQTTAITSTRQKRDLCEAAGIDPDVSGGNPCSGRRSRRVSPRPSGSTPESLRCPYRLKNLDLFLCLH